MGITHRDPEGELIASLTYSYDRVGHRTQESLSDGSVRHWSYDGRYQLLNERCVAGDEETGPAAYDVTYTYDPAGNRASRNDGSTLTTYQYSKANRLTQLSATDLESGGVSVTTYAYDGAGHRTQVSSDLQGRSYFTWDARERMTEADVPAGLAQG